MNNEAMHRNTRDALVFAFNFSGQQFAKSTLAEAIGGDAMRQGRGLVAETGAADAAFIWNELYALSAQNPLYLAVLYARYAPHGYPCDCGSLCCSGTKRNGRWLDVINFLTKAAHQHVQETISHHRVRQAVILNIFSPPEKEWRTLGAVADQCNVSRNTASKYNSLIRAWICGIRDTSGKTVHVGIEQLAFEIIDERLRAMGEVES